MAAHVLKYNKHAVYHSSFVKTILQKYLKLMNIPRTEKFSILDVGCGDGKILFDNLYPLLPNNCEEIIATDIDESMVKYCKDKYSQSDTTFLQMDIANDDIPGDLKERFGAIFSSFCFMYVRNIRGALVNCRKMLQTNRDILLLLISKKNPLYSTYAELSKIDIWKPYTKEFQGFVPHFSSEDPHSELKSLAEQVDLKVVGSEFMHDNTFESSRKNFLEVFKSMDIIYRTIPEEKRGRYIKDFGEIFSDISGLDVTDTERLDEPAIMHIPLAAIHMRKCPS